MRRLGPPSPSLCTLNSPRHNLEIFKPHNTPTILLRAAKHGSIILPCRTGLADLNPSLEPTANTCSSSTVPASIERKSIIMFRIQNKTLLTFVILDLLFLVCGGLLIAIAALGHIKIGGDPSEDTVAQILLLDECPLTAAIINGVFMLITFAISIPGLFLKKNRLLLTIHAWLLILNAIFTLCVGLAIWYTTLQTKANLEPVWNRQSSFVQSMLQFKFQCCGYRDTSVFVQNDVCTSAAVAATKGPCDIPFSAFANSFLDIVFTTVFAFCAVDGLLLLSGLCVLKDRAEKARYKLIDEKRSYTGYSYGRF